MSENARDLAGRRRQRRRKRARALALVLALASGCAQGGAPDAGYDAGQGRADASARDAGPDVRRDAGRDAGSVDAGEAPDVDADVPSCAPSAGNLAIVEVMVASRSGSGDLGEWFEVKNVGDCTIDLAGLVIASPSAPQAHTVDEGFLPPGSLFVFAQSAEASDNHGVSVDHAYGGGITFSNSADSLSLSHGGSVVDHVTWSSTSHRVGTSRQRPSGSTPGGDLTGAPWCDSTETYGEGSLYHGTPGMPNHGC